jgi:hypothetical protein
MMGATGTDFSLVTHPAARREHRCEWCGQKILKGEKHYKFNGVWQGDFQNWRMHTECSEAWDQENEGDGFSPFENQRPESNCSTANRTNISDTQSRTAQST